MNTSQSQNFGKALYYPYIHIQDVSWLKLSLLYFDGIRRIVPDGYSPNDSEDVRQVVERGLLEPTSPYDYREKAAEKFKQDFLPLLEQKIPESQKALERSSKAFRKNRISTRSLHLDKLTYALIQRLKDRGLAYSVGDWLKVDSHIAGSYMLCLAAVMSNSIQAPPVTDTPEYQEIGEYLSCGQLPYKPSTEQNSVLFKLGIDFPSLESLINIPISKILDFHERRRDERRRFREELQAIIGGASQLKDQYAVEDYLNQKRQGIMSAIEEQRKVLNELNIKLFGSLLSISAPTTIATTAGLMVPPIASVLTGAGIAVSLVKWWAEVRSGQRETERRSAWNYLLSAQKLYQPKTPLGKQLWQIRQKAIAEGESLLTSEEIEQELIERRGGYRES